MNGSVELLTSPKARPIAAARRLSKRAFRAGARAFLVEGPQAVAAALAEPGAVHELFVTPQAATRHADLVAAASAAGVLVRPTADAALATLAQTVTPQGLVAVAGFRDRSIDVVVSGQPRLVAVLASVRDPGNAGTVVRAADAAGADAVVFTSASVDPYNGKCVRASAGSLFHLPFVAGVPTETAVQQLREAGLQIVATAGDGETELEDAVDSGLLARPVAWLFGNEAWGLPPDVRRLADASVRVPIYGRAESLNLATAAVLCLYASARCRVRVEG